MHYNYAHSSKNLVHGTDVIAGANKTGVFIPISTDCTETNVCKITLAIEEQGVSAHGQNNNSQTSIQNANPVSSGVYYAYTNGRSDAGQCVFKDYNYLQYSGSLKVAAVIAATGKSAKILKDEEGVSFN